MFQQLKDFSLPRFGLGGNFRHNVTSRFHVTPRAARTLLRNQTGFRDLVSSVSSQLEALDTALADAAAPTDRGPLTLTDFLSAR